MTPVKEFITLQDAYIAKGLLESQGIPSVVLESAISVIFPTPDAGTGDIMLYVADDDAERAREILSRHGGTGETE